MGAGYGLVQSADATECLGLMVKIKEQIEFHMNYGMAKYQQDYMCFIVAMNLSASIQNI